MGIKKTPIIIFSNMRYDSPIEATSLFIARNLAEDRLVYYVVYPYTIKDFIDNKTNDTFLKLRKSFFNVDDALIDTEIPNLKNLILPLVTPINFIPEGKVFRKLLKFNERLIVKRIKEVLNKQGIKDFVFLNSFNFYYPDVSNRLKPLLKVYQCIDPMITPYDMRHGLVSELQLVKESDMVICTSKALYDEKIKINANTFFVPNAADLSHTSKALDKETAVHPLLKNISKPIIGYFGSIERRMDYDIIKKVVKANPNKSFVFAGPAINEHIPEWFFNTPNIHILGQIPYEEMPGMLKGFDIAIIPFKKDDVSTTIFPLKLFEYLGAGNPVIITDFNPDLKDYTHGAVEVCGDAASFTKAINNTLKNDGPEQQALRLSVAQENTWQIRSKEIADLIEKGLAKKFKR